jgi:hypothetical protein
VRCKGVRERPNAAGAHSWCNRCRVGIPFPSCSQPDDRTFLPSLLRTVAC